MTREVIYTLKKHKIMFQHDFGWDTSTLKALDMAIKALEKDQEVKSMKRPLDFGKQIDTADDLRKLAQIMKMLKSDYSIEDKKTALLVYDLFYRIENGATLESLWEASYGDMHNM